MAHTEIGTCDKAIIQRLKAGSGVTDIVGTHIYLNEVPIGVDAPAVVVQFANQQEIRVQDVKAGCNLWYDVRATVPSADSQAADAILAECDALLDSYAVNLNNFRLKFVRDGMGVMPVREREKVYRTIRARYMVIAEPY